MGSEVMDILLRARMEVSGVEAGIGQIQKSLKGLTLPKGVTDNLEKSFSKLSPLLKEYQKQLNKGFSNKKDLQNFNALKEKISETFGEIRTQVQSINSQKVRLKVDTQEIDKLENKIANKSASLQKALSSVFTKTINTSNIKDQLDQVMSSAAKAPTVKPMIETAQKLFNTQDYAAYNSQIDIIKNKILSLKTSKINLATILGVKDAENNLTAVNEKISSFFNNLKVNEGKVQTIENLKRELKEAGLELDNLKLDSLARGSNELQGLDGLLDRVASSMRETGDAASQAGQGMVRMVDEVNDLRQSTQYFFSLRNMLNLLKRGIDDAIQSVKDLDAAMTETAVVTDYKVSDLWNMLPEYTQLANQLGATTQGAYETMTLYFQQGLNQQQAFEIGAETMKMARIAGLDYAETTDMMTAALRGFNMELDETSAKRVNDVYSELAAITASDTEELGTAMQRTASIAHSAGASFEGATAFLAQAIETTREPAENIGTAMKTIIARFQEMKKNPLEISEVDGEEVDYNKIDAALKTIGIDLKDTNGQFRDWDKVMLDIAAKWDTLSQSQQRYIATVAAGSRQQSRFIAMVSNYDRTVQLMEAANNSAGASDEQFGKTMDSLESKLNKLHNAWEQFTMGIANNGMIKFAVDGLTGFLNITNKIINALSLGSGTIKSFLSVFAAFTGLKVAGRAANSLIGGLGGLVDPQSTVKEGLKIGLFGQGKANAQAQAITTPIVGVLNKISGQISQIKNTGINNKTQSNSGIRNTSKQEYRDVKAQFDKLSWEESFKMSDASNLFGKLDAKHQRSLFNNSPGTKRAMKKASMAWFDSKGLSEELTNSGKLYIDSIYKGMQEGQISVDEGINLIGRPDLWGQHFADDTAQAISKHFADKANIAAEKGAWRQLGMKGVSDEAKQAFLADEENRKKYEKLRNESYEKAAQGIAGHGGAEGKVSSLGRLANDIGSIGDKFTQAGYGITAFGSALSQLGGPIGAVGTGIATLGGAISSMGMMVSGATSLITVFSEGIQIAGTSIAISGGAIAAVVGPLAAAAAAFLLVRAHIKKVKEAGEEVTKTFNDINKETTDNISRLKSYQGEFANLAKGVDSNGNNVSLDDSQYQRYLEIVKDIAAINPDIIQGYNAQGHAIIDNNTALEETLKLQEKIQEKAVADYTDTSSLQKLINARNVDANYTGTKARSKKSGIGYGEYGFGSEARLATTTGGMASDVFNIANQLRLTTTKDDLGNKIKIDSNMLKKYGIESMDALISGEEQAVKNFIKHREQIETDLTNSGFKLSESVLQGFDKLNEDQKAFDEAIQPIYDNLLASVSNSKIFESIAPEFRDALNIGLKDLASQDLSATEMSEAAKDMATRFADLSSDSGEYGQALKTVEEAQDHFAATLNETQYKADVQPAIDNLNKLKEAALEEGGAYGQALSEYLENQIARISNFTQEGAENITGALNTATDEIAAAESALENFNNATEKDYWTAAEGMKGIFGKVTETYEDSYGTEIQKHSEGMGDITFWTGADSLLSQKAIEKATKGKNGYDAAEAVKKRIADLEPLLRDGQEGFDAFTDRVLENADAMDKLADAGVKYDKESGFITDIPEDQWHNVAEALGISDELLTSMINKGRQFADISFMNLDEARKSLAASDFTIKGTSAAKDEEQNLYVKEETLRTHLSEAGYVRKDQQDEQIKLLEEQNKVIALRNASEYKGEKGIAKLNGIMQDMGVTTLRDLISTLEETGDYNKDEIKAYADKLGLLANDENYDKTYSDIISEKENPELTKQTAELESINSKLGILINGTDVDTAERNYNENHDTLFGESGVDTGLEAFSLGKKLDENGNLSWLDPGEYTELKKSYENLAKSYREQAQEAEYMASQTTGAEQKRWKTIAKGYDEDADNIEDMVQKSAEYIKEYEDGLKKGEAVKQEKEAEKEAYNKSPEGRAERKFNNKGFGNAGLTWGPEAELNGQVFSYGEGKTGVSLAVTPMLQVKGKPPEELSDNVIDDYLNQIIGQATNSKTGKVDMSKLMELDQKGLEVQGKQVHDLIMGGFTGKNAKENAKAFTDLEKNLDVTIKKAQHAKILRQNLAKDASKKIVKNTVSNAKTTTETTNKVVKEVKQTQEETTKKETKETTVTAKGKTDPSFNKTKKEVKDLEDKNGTKVNIKTEGDSSGAEKVKESVENIEDKKVIVESIGITAGAEAVQKAVDNVDGKKTVKISADTSDLRAKVVAAQVLVNTLKASAALIKVGKTGATGINNYIPHRQAPSYGSAARGRHGTVGPKDKGGLTLTGEKGFEIAWIPSENRSMILGATGPQMLNLPPDAVIYTHEQSKDILKRKSIPAGSHAAESHGSGYKKKYQTVNTVISTSTTGGVAKAQKASKDKRNKDLEKAAKEVITISQKAGKVLVWWENAAHRMNKAQNTTEKIQKQLERLLLTFGTTLGEYQKLGKSLEKSLQTQVSIANQRITRAKSELRMSDTGVTYKDAGIKAKTSSESKAQAKAKKKQDKAEAKMKAAQKKYNKKGTAANKKAYKKAKNEYNKAKKAYNKTAGAKKDAARNNYAEAIGARAEVSYEVTQTKKKKNKKGKVTTTKSKVNKTKKVDLAKYITTDSETGAYIINQKAITDLAKKNKSLAEAVKEATEKQLNSLNSQLESAEKDREDALEKIEEFYNNAYEAFNQWDKVITDVYLLGLQLDRIDKIRSVYEAAEEYEYDKLTAGFGSAIDSLPKIQTAMKNSVDLMVAQARANAQMVDAAWNRYADAFSLETGIIEFDKFNQSTDASRDLTAKQTTLNFLKEIGFNQDNFDYEQVMAALDSLYDQRWQNQDYDKIKEGIDKIAEEQNAYYEALANTYTTLSDIYKRVEEDQAFMADFEDSLIKGMEEQSNKQINKLSKLNTSLSNAAKDLLDEVKRKLDERRKKEDNQKTEQDLTQKQQRLAMLRADTAGGHATEIAQLEKEIADARQNYGRTLEDQLLDRMTQQQDAAQKQRERQISLLEAQRDLAEALGSNVEEVNRWLQNPNKYAKEIEEAWMANNGSDEKGFYGLQQLEQQFTTTATKATAIVGELVQLEKLIKEQSEKEEDNVETDGEQPVKLPTLKDISDKMDTIIKSLNQRFPDFDTEFSLERLAKMGISASTAKAFLGERGTSVSAKQMLDAGFDKKSVGQAYTVKESYDSGIKDASTLKEMGYSSSKISSVIPSQKTNTSTNKNQTSTNNSYAAALKKVKNKKPERVTKGDINNLFDLGSKNKYGKATVLKHLVTKDSFTKKDPFNWKNIFHAIIEAKGISRYNLVKTFGSNGSLPAAIKTLKNNPNTIKEIKKHKKYKKAKKLAYATGGLADYTGPAWLDGTPSKPELVLNAQDTKNFIALKDVLSKAVGSTSQIENSYGGNATYEININVDHISNDYDVDRVVKKVKKEIVEGSGYRNVTQVRKFR